MTQQDLHGWFRRTIGGWTSERRYIFDMTTHKAVNMTTEFVIAPASDPQWHFSVNWEGNTQGEMLLFLSGNELKRSIGYFTSEPTVSQMTMTDKDTLVMVTSYDGQTFREEVKLMYDDTVRLRQTIGHDSTTGLVTLVGQYYESRTF